MGQGNSVKSEIQSFIVKQFPTARKRGLNDDLPLLESGILDSLGVLDVVAFLEQRFEIKLADEELTPENFANIKYMTSFVEEKLRRTHAQTIS